jgi:hypothetical protein
MVFIKEFFHINIHIPKHFAVNVEVQIIKKEVVGGSLIVTPESVGLDPLHECGGRAGRGSRNPRKNAVVFAGICPQEKFSFDFL